MDTRTEYPISDTLIKLWELLGEPTDYPEIFLSDSQFDTAKGEMLRKDKPSSIRQNKFMLSGFVIKRKS